jgi:hypothetical protein
MGGLSRYSILLANETDYDVYHCGDMELMYVLTVVWSLTNLHRFQENGCWYIQRPSNVQKILSKLE